jgi:hypothetical protein
MEMRSCNPIVLPGSLLTINEIRVLHLNRGVKLAV